VLGVDETTQVGCVLFLAYGTSVDDMTSSQHKACMKEFIRFKGILTGRLKQLASYRKK